MLLFHKNSFIKDLSCVLFIFYFFLQKKPALLSNRSIFLFCVSSIRVR